MTLFDKVSIPPQVMARTVGEETVILDLATGTYFGLDPVGARIWELMSEGRTLAEICDQMLEEYEEIILQLPDIGGSDNPLIGNLVQAGAGLAFYRALRAHGGTVEEAGGLINLGVERRLKRIPAFLFRLMAKFMFSRRRVRKMKKYAQFSQERNYPDDWVWEIFEGDGQSYDIGIDYTECAIQKYMRHQDADELIPYLCNTDYIVFGAAGMELKRTKTLAWGCDRCDFRIKKRGSPSPAWPPQFVERRCGEIVEK